MTRARSVVAIGFALVLGGCCIPGFAPSAPPAPAPPVSTSAPVAEPVVAPPPAAGALCLAGRWRASELLALVQRDMRSGLRGSDIQLVSATGNLVADIAPSDATGHGTMTVRAENLVHRLRGRPQGIAVDITHTLNGNATMPYAFTAPDQLHVDRATESTIRGQANANAAGYRVNQRTAARFDLRGDYVFVCSPTTLTVTEHGGRPLSFTREP